MMSESRPVLLSPHMTTHSMSFKDVLSDRSVRRLWIAQLISVFGDFLALFAVFSLVTFQLHGTPTQVAMILVSFLVPMAKRSTSFTTAGTRI